MVWFWEVQVCITFCYVKLSGKVGAATFGSCGKLGGRPRGNEAF